MNIFIHMYLFYAAHDAIQFDTHHPEGMRKIAALESRKTADKGPEQDKVSSSGTIEETFVAFVENYSTAFENEYCLVIERKFHIMFLDIILITEYSDVC